MKDLEAEIVTLPEGHPRALQIINEIVALQPRLQLDHAEPAPVVPPPKVHPLAGERFELPDPPPGQSWDLPMLAELKAGAERAGMGDHVLPLLYVVRDEMATGRQWTEEASFESLTLKFGEHEADALVADAQAAGASLPPSAKRWLNLTGLHTNPEVITYLARAWRTRQGG